MPKLQLAGFQTHSEETGETCAVFFVFLFTINLSFDKGHFACRGQTATVLGGLAVVVSLRSSGGYHAMSAGHNVICI